MKTCGFENQINLYLDNELSGAKLRSFEAHLQACPRCREEVEQVRELLGGLNGLEDREVPPMLQDLLHSALLNEIEKGDGRVKRKFNPWALTAAAAVLVVFIIGGSWLLGGGNSPLHSNATANDLSTQTRLRVGQSLGYSADVLKPSIDQGDTVEAAATAAPVPAPNAPMASAPDNATAQSSPSMGADFKALDTTAANGQTQPVNGLKIIYTANLVLETREFDKSLAQVNALQSKYGGYTANSQINGVPQDSVGQGRTAVITMRMPIDKYGTAMGELQALGNLLSKNESTEDVSRQYIDTEARNKELTLERDSLYALLAKADSMDSIIALQNQITTITTQIEQDTQQLRFWDDQVAYSTITVQLNELLTPTSVKPADPDLNTRANGAFYNTLNDMKKDMENLSIWFMGSLPWLVVILVIAGIALAIALPLTRKARRAAKLKTDTDKKKEE